MFPFELLVLFSASGEFGVLVRAIILVFEFHSINFKTEESEFARARGDFLGQFPVARHGGNGAISPENTEENSDEENDVITREVIMFQAEIKTAEMMRQRGHGKLSISFYCVSDSGIFE